MLVAVAVLALIAGLGMSLFLLVPLRDPGSQALVEPVLRGQVYRLEVEVDALQVWRASPSSTQAAAAEIFQQDLKRHEELLNDLRSERALTEQREKEANELLQEARETEQRTRGAAALFLGIFGAIAAVLLGQGYYQFRGWKAQADEALEGAAAIRTARETLESKLPEYIEEVQRSLALDSPSATAVAKMDEIDHLTYLSDPQIRFQEGRSREEAKRYLESLLSAARGHIARKNNQDAENRLHEFFAVLEEHPDAVDETTKASAYSNRAFVCWRMLKEISASPSWVRHIKQAQAADLRTKAFLNVAKARGCDPKWEHGHFVEALLYGYQWVPNDVKDPKLKLEMEIEGQKMAAEKYEKIIALGAHQSQGFAAWQNLACSLKLLAEASGDHADYVTFMDRLKSYPTDDQLHSWIVAGGKQETERHFLWQDMLADEELFGSVKLNHADYRKFWEDLLTEKVRTRKWKEDLAELKLVNPKMTGWILP